MTHFGWGITLRAILQKSERRGISITMPVFARLICLLARRFQALADFVNRFSNFFYGLLPIFLRSSQLAKLVQESYVPGYQSAQLSLTDPTLLHALLSPWELDLLNRYNVQSGRMLVMGAGLGREAIAISRRGVRVVGIDANFVALRLATRIAEALKTPAAYHQADFLTLPYVPASFDFAFLTTLMYSSIPGLEQRRAWLKELGPLLKPGGLLFLSFLRLPQPLRASPFRSLRKKVSSLLAKLPGTNPAYQVGDECPTGHFLHEFQNETELRDELNGAGVSVRELNWSQGFAVISFPDRGPAHHPSDWREASPQP